MDETVSRHISPRPPADRSGVWTERPNPRSANLHRLSVSELVALFIEEDREVFRALEEARRDLAEFIGAAEVGFNAGGRLIYLGAGTSGRLGVLDASEAPPTFQVPPDRVIGIIAGGDLSLRRSSEGAEDDPEGAVPELERLNLTPADTVLGIAAGGTTPYVLGALEWVSSNSPETLTGLLTSSPPPTPPRARHLIVLNTGPELIAGSTRLKAGTAAKMVLNIISTALMVRSGRVYRNLMVELRPTNEKLRDRAARIVMELTGLSRPQALHLLDECDGKVKVAVVMARLHLSAADAAATLAAHHNRLDEVLGD